MLLVVDNGSLYTKNLTEFLSKKRIPFEAKTPDRIDTDLLSRYGSFILSGRRENARKTNQTNSRVVRHAIESGSKLLGICYGAEILALTLGGTIRKCESLRKGDETVRVSSKNDLIRADSLLVFESHSFEISRLPKELISVGESPSCRYEIIRHVDRPVFGTQFHPEMSSDGTALIERFCRL